MALLLTWVIGIGAVGADLLDALPYRTGAMRTFENPVQGKFREFTLPRYRRAYGYLHALGHRYRKWHGCRLCRRRWWQPARDRRPYRARGAWGLEGSATPATGPGQDVLRRALRPGAGRVRLRRVATLEGVRRGGPGGQGGGAVASGEDADRRALRGASQPLRRGVLGRHEEAAGRGTSRPVRERDAALPAQALPARKPRRRRLAEDPAVGRLRPEETPARIVAAGTFPLPRSLGMNFS